MTDSYGGLILTLHVPVRPVQWQVVTGKKNRRRAQERLQQGLAATPYAKWKDDVALVAAAGGPRRTLIDRPVWIDTAFFLRPPARANWLPDADNLRKGFVDAMQGCIITNDTIVRGGFTDRIVAESIEEGAIAHVYEVAQTLDDADAEAAWLARAHGGHPPWPQGSEVPPQALPAAPDHPLAPTGDATVRFRESRRSVPRRRQG